MQTFLVEGDSAGSAKQARDRKISGDHAAESKINPARKSRRSAGFAEIARYFGSYRYRSGDDLLSQLRYGKICIWRVAARWSAHCATLLCALFKTLRALVKRSRLRCCRSPY